MEKLYINFHYRFPNIPIMDLEKVDGFGTIVAHTCINTLEVPIQTILMNDGTIDDEMTISIRFVALFLYCYTTGFQIS
tara:strand:- start:1137 stop:1370 length:234 start_codon:yes stop_codon:yes gene_type:complete